MLIRHLRSLTLAIWTFSAGAIFAADNPFLGDWALTLPGGAAGWLGVDETNGQLSASMMWVAGSVEPVASAKVEDGKLLLTPPVHGLPGARIAIHGLLQFRRMSFGRMDARRHVALRRWPIA